MPRPRKGRGGSAGVAEHRVVEIRRVTLSRTINRTRLTALACVVALGLTAAPSAASAQESTASLAAARAAIDQTAAQWFAAQRQLNDLDLQIQTLAKTLAPTEARVGRLRELAGARAVELYESNPEELSSMMGADVMASDPLEVGRRAALISQANRDDQVVIDELEAAIGDLAARRDALVAARDAQAGTLSQLATKRNELDAQLASLSRRATRASAGSELAAAVRPDTETATTAAPTASTPTVPAETPAPDTQSVEFTPPAHAAVSPHHDEPFLVCTRARESSGDYAAVSSNGYYYGAYQFLPTTWNSVASHAGRLDLVGVVPSHAAEYDQDEMAWALYTWQGNAPWGGRC
jgi:peptidoglycan hydrolase CwlO-like protein